MLFFLVMIILSDSIAALSIIHAARDAAQCEFALRVALAGAEANQQRFS